MAKTLYCWRCKTDVPMLDEQEWQQVLAPLRDGIELFKGYRAKNNAGLGEANGAVYRHGALTTYFEITGYEETTVEALWHHRLCLLGPPCDGCRKPLRTPKAKMCAECGTARNTAC
jgi:hypothetical protein